MKESAYILPRARAMGDISTHVISKLGAPSIAGSKVRLFFNENLGAGFMDAGWNLVKEAALSANGGIDDLVPIGSLKRGVYLVEYDFSGMDAASRQIFKKQEDGTFNPLNPTGFFLAQKTCVNLKIEDPTSFNHLVLSVGDKVDQPATPNSAQLRPAFFARRKSPCAPGCEHTEYCRRRVFSDGSAAVQRATRYVPHSERF